MRAAVPLLIMAACGRGAEPTADHAPAAAAPPHGMQAPAGGDPAETARLTELARVEAELDTARKALDDARARHAPAATVEPLDRRVAELRARERALLHSDESLTRALAQPPQLGR